MTKTPMGPKLGKFDFKGILVIVFFRKTLKKQKYPLK
jgi:hypothetical protein